jgi:hypothetical protein
MSVGDRPNQHFSECKRLQFVAASVSIAASWQGAFMHELTLALMERIDGR